MKQDDQKRAFTVMKNDILGSMVDVHDRRPVAFAFEDALMRMHDTFTWEGLIMFVRQNFATPVESNLSGWQSH